MKNKADIVFQFHKTKDVAERLHLAEQYILLQKETFKPQNHIHQYPNYPEDVELFEDIEGWEGIYQIGNLGSIKAVEGFFIKKRARSNDYMAVYKPELIRTRRKNKLGYIRTSLWRDGKAKHYNVHVLVAKHFIPNPKKYPQVGHLDNNPSNPSFKNLVWGTQSHNIQYCVKSGRWHTGSKNNKAKLKESDIPKIREMIKAGKSFGSIGALFGVTDYPIYSIKRGRTWAHVK